MGVKKKKHTKERKQKQCHIIKKWEKEKNKYQMRKKRPYLVKVKDTRKEIKEKYIKRDREVQWIGSTSKRGEWGREKRINERRRKQEGSQCKLRRNEKWKIRIYKREKTVRK